MENFVEVAKADEIPSGTATVVEVQGTEVALVNIDGQFYALGNECTHAGGPLGEGDVVEEFGLECPLHGSVYDVRTGEPIVGPSDEPVPSYPATVEDGVVKIAID